MSVDDPKTSADGDEDETKSGITFQLALKELRTASWYWGPISPQKAEHLLNNQPPGTFLLRDSRNERYFFSFSYRTDQGCFHTHVGLHCGRWCLGGPNSLIRSDSFSLIEFVNKAINASNDKNHYEILLHHRVPDETTASIQLKNGFSRYRTATLKYFARLAIRNSLRSELNLNKLMIGLRSFVGTLRRNASIFAMSSGSLPAALAIVRISGPESKDVLRRLTKKSEFETNRLFYSPIYDVEKQELIDRCMLVFLKGPRTFTGEDTAEIFCHGSKAVVAKLLETLSQIDGLSPAKAGEFTRRAFFNKKMDVAEVESLNDLLQAETPLQLRLAHRQNEASKRLKPFRDSLINITAQVEASIDFAEDIEDQQHLEWKRQTIAKSRKLKDELSDLLKSTCRAILIRRGVKVALVGRTNVGKSSLINRLAERDVAIVSNLPGTTRDSLETRIFLNGNLPLTIFDTAGLRTTTDELENEGIVRTIKRVNEAHIVVFVISAEDIVFNGNFSIDQEINYLKSSLTDVPIANVVLCLNKSDLLSQQHKSSLLADTKLPIILINTLSNEAVSPLISTLAERMSDLANENNDLFLSRERHVHLLETIIDQLEEFENAIDVDIAIAAQHLKNCTLAIGEITGQVTNDTIMNKVFSEFCIGK